MTDASASAPKAQDQTPTLDPVNAIHAKVMALDEAGLHMRREELRRIEAEGGLSFDDLTELCAVLAQMRKKKAGPPSEAKTRKRMKDAKSFDVMSLKF